MRSAGLVISPQVTLPRETPRGFHYKRSKASWVNAADRRCANTHEAHASSGASHQPTANPAASVRPSEARQRAEASIAANPIDQRGAT